MTTTVKHGNFICEPMGDKPATDLPGIGEVLGSKLQDKAYQVLGEFLVLKKNKQNFVEWLNQTIGANTKQAGDCFQGLSAWCDEFL